jgi:TonB family protein
MLARRMRATVFAVCSLLVSRSAPAFAQREVVESGRKVVNKVEPMYPDFARRSALKGTVKLEAVVDATGKVKVVKIRGGHPLLAQAAARAVSNWTWEAAPNETREAIEVQFSPQ